jgi:hypothetical protein
MYHRSGQNGDRMIGLFTLTDLLSQDINVIFPFIFHGFSPRVAKGLPFQ